MFYFKSSDINFTTTDCIFEAPMTLIASGDITSDVLVHTDNEIFLTYNMTIFDNLFSN